LMRVVILIIEEGYVVKISMYLWMNEKFLG